MHHHYKLIPDVPNRYGAIVLNKPLDSDSRFAVDIGFKFLSDPNLSHGLAIMLLDQQPVFPDDFHEEFGYRTDFKGLGVFLYRSESRGKWYVLSIQNKGLQDITRSRDFDDLINNKNSCEFDMNQDTMGGIRIKVLLDYIYVEKRDANGNTSYTKCLTN